MDWWKRWKVCYSRVSTADKMDYYGLEYRYVTRYILKEFTYDEMFGRLNTAIHQFAKRQMTYFRGMERRGVEIHWLEGQLTMEEKLDKALELLSSCPDCLREFYLNCQGRSIINQISPRDIRIFSAVTT